MISIRQDIRRRLQQILGDRRAQQRVKRARYMREVYRPSRQSLNLTLTVADYERLAAAAQTAGYRPRTYARELVLAALDRQPVVPRGLEEALWAAADQLRAIGHNVNQIARQAHRQRALPPDTLAALPQRITALEAVLEQQVFALCRSWS